MDTAAQHVPFSGHSPFVGAKSVVVTCQFADVSLMQQVPHPRAILSKFWKDLEGPLDHGASCASESDTCDIL